MWGLSHPNPTWEHHYYGSIFWDKRKCHIQKVPSVSRTVTSSRFKLISSPKAKGEEKLVLEAGRQHWLYSLLLSRLRRLKNSSHVCTRSLCNTSATNWRAGNVKKTSQTVQTRQQIIFMEFNIQLLPYSKNFPPYNIRISFSVLLHNYYDLLLSAHLKSLFHFLINM